MATTEDYIDSHSYVAFQNVTGLSVSIFLLVSFYLKSTFATWNEKLFIRKNGVCIGSCIAPLSSDIYLAFYDKVLFTNLEDLKVAKMFRFVVD